MTDETYAHWKESRQIVKRIVVTGDLVLLTPTHLGSGETASSTDMSLLRDPLDNRKALLTGASITGALRNYLREVTCGYGGAPGKKSALVQLFGGERGDDAGAQSLLIVDDALSCESARIEIRDGVRIDPETGTAASGAKFDIELLQAGTTFPLRFELLIPERQNAAELETALVQALYGLENAEIGLGARKRRGFGRCQVERWCVVSYDLTTADGLMAWLEEDEAVAHTDEGAKIVDLLQVGGQADDAREHFTVDATFWLDGSLLIRADAESGVDAGHLRSHRPGQGNVPVLPGTSLAGVLRHRALRIANTLATDGHGQRLIEEMFGSSERNALTASRVLVRETVVEGTRPLVQSRVKIDRFTGGAYPTALFSEEPVFGGPDSRVRVDVELRNPKDYEIGLLLLLLKDLWTGDLPLGGESSVGRGRLQGLEANLHWQDQDDGSTDWMVSQTETGLQVTGDPFRLEQCVTALRKHLTEEVSDDQDS
jgi:CRISPR/Cas system CSM-associated protein Csm3 (group 7 of RAMP superfamily)